VILFLSLYRGFLAAAQHFSTRDRRAGAPERSFMIEIHYY
jgi:hypothetical protein